MHSGQESSLFSFFAWPFGCSVADVPAQRGAHGKCYSIGLAFKFIPSRYVIVSRDSRSRWCPSSCDRSGGDSCRRRPCSSGANSRDCVCRLVLCLEKVGLWQGPKQTDNVTDVTTATSGDTRARAAVSSKHPPQGRGGSEESAQHIQSREYAWADGGSRRRKCLE
jgi:hypothetical protein